MTTFFYTMLVLAGVSLHRRFPDVKSINEIADALITLTEVPARLVYAKVAGYFEAKKEEPPKRIGRQAA